MRGKELAREHASFIRSLLQTHGEDPKTLDKLMFHYTTAFVHGYKHGLEDAINQLNLKTIGYVLFFFGLGVLFHDYLHTMWILGGYPELLSPQGGYFGLIIEMIGFVLIQYNDFVRRLKRLVSLGR